MNLIQSLVNHGNLFFKVGMTDVNDMEKEVGLTNLIEGGFERFYQAMRQFADKTDGVGEEFESGFPSEYRFIYSFPPNFSILIS